MAILVQTKGDALPKVLAEGNHSVCLTAGSQADAAGEPGLAVWDERKGIIWTGKGLIVKQAEARAASLEAQKKSQEQKNAAATLAAQKRNAESANAELAKAQERADAEQAAADAAEAALAAVTPKPQPAKQPKKKAAAKS